MPVDLFIRDDGPETPCKWTSYPEIYTEEERGTVAMAMSVAAAIKKVLDTPILSESGELTTESLTVHGEIQAYVDSLDAAGV